jgi:hypothetical protein
MHRRYRHTRSGLAAVARRHGAVAGVVQEIDDFAAVCGIDDNPLKIDIFI